jgi:predicted ATPase/serine/threonine protein kinase
MARWDRISPTMSLSNGTRLGPYEILAPIGAGGMGEVYKARDTRLDRTVAIKVLPEHLSQKPDRRERFEREARAVSSLNHPHICTLYDIGSQEGIDFLVMEYLEGETLAHQLKKGALPIDQTLRYGIEIASALDAAHRKGITHRDLKPGNVMLIKSGTKLLDFGLARMHAWGQTAGDSAAATQTDPMTVEGSIVGTLFYLSPEQARGLATDARTDIWALGCVLYEIVTGHRPFAGATVADVLASIITTTPAPLTSYCPDAPANLQEIVSKALAKDKEERYQDVKDLMVDLQLLQKRLDFEAELGRREIWTGDDESACLPPNNLSAARASMVGREQEIEKICGELRREGTRLLTLTGVGGTGKTTLAHAAAGHLLRDFSDGVFFVELGAIKQADLVASTIAQPLGAKEADGKPSVEALKDYLRERSMLLVLDSLEHLPTAPSILAELLAAAPRLKMLVTSRALLRLSLEREYMVQPLGVPETLAQASPDELARSEAVRLFVERARGVKENFALTEENARSVAEICVRVDGLPLAIELAAARMKILSPQAILSRLDHRLKLLTGGARDLPTRQQTISGAVEWSYELLTEGEKQLFRRLAVFAGGFTLEAAEGVVGGCTSVAEPIDVLEGITSLADKSLLAAKPQSRGDIRFRMLEVVREYALDRLETSGEAEEMRRHHGAYFLAFAEEAEPHLQGAQPAEWLNRLEEDHDNIRSAMRWWFTYDAGAAARLGAAIRYFWDFQGHLAEGLAVSKAILSLRDLVPAAIRWKLLSMAGNLAKFQGDHETARKMYEEGLSDGRATHDLRQISLSCRGLGGLAYEQGDLASARQFVDEALAAARESNDRFGIARSLNMLGDLARSLGDDAAARSWYEEALAICRQLGNKYATANIFINLAAAEYGEGDYDAAHAHFTEGLTMMARESGDQIVGDKIAISYSLDGFAALAVLRGETELAAKLAGAAERLRESINYNVEPAERHFREAYLTSLRAALSEEDFSRAYGQGRKLKLDEGVALALAWKREHA